MNKILDNLRRNIWGWSVFGLACFAAWAVRAIILAVFPLTPLGTIFALAILLPSALIAWLVSKASNKIKLIQAQKLAEQFEENEKHRIASETSDWENKLRVAQISSKLEQETELDETSNTKRARI